MVGSPQSKANLPISGVATAARKQRLLRSFSSKALSGMIKEADNQDEFVVAGVDDNHITMLGVKWNWRAFFKQLARTVVVCGGYVGAVVAFGYGYKKWGITDSVYYALATMSTVGSGGDLMIQYDVTEQLASLAFVYFGMLFAFAELSSLVTFATAPFFKAARDCLEKLFPQSSVDIDGDGFSDIKLPRGVLIYYGKNLLCPLIVIFGGNNLWAYGFMRAEGWTYLHAWYTCMTMFSFGYGGSGLPLTYSGRLLAIGHMTFFISLLGALLSEVVELRDNRKHQLKRAELLKRRLDPKLIAAVDRNGDGVTQSEFALGMLITLGVVKEEDVTPYLKQFKRLDADGSGRLTAADLEKDTLALRRRLKGRKGEAAAEERGMEGGGGPSGIAKAATAAVPTPPSVVIAVEGVKERLEEVRLDVEEKLMSQSQALETMASMLTKLTARPPPGERVVASPTKKTGDAAIMAAIEGEPDEVSPEKAVVRLSRDMATVSVQQLELMQETKSLRAELVRAFAEEEEEVQEEADRVDA